MNLKHEFYLHDRRSLSRYRVATSVAFGAFLLRGAAAFFRLRLTSPFRSVTHLRNNRCSVIPNANDAAALCRPFSRLHYRIERKTLSSRFR